jgi:hypothetical protein
MFWKLGCYMSKFSIVGHVMSDFCQEALGEKFKAAWLHQVPAQSNIDVVLFATKDYCDITSGITGDF